MIYTAQPEEGHIINQGRFIIRAISPGLKLNNPADNAIGPLGRVDHATLAPGMIVRMHPHQNDEILSYMRRGTMVHEDIKPDFLLYTGHKNGKTSIKILINFQMAEVQVNR